jgi:hypothetical protein
MGHWPLDLIKTRQQFWTTASPVFMDQAMIAIRFTHYVIGAMAVAILLACDRTGQAEVGKRMARRAAELDRLSMLAGNAGLPPVRILIPVGGHDGNPPNGAPGASRALRMTLEGRIEAARHSHWPRLEAARPRSNNSHGNPGPDLAGAPGGTAAAPFWNAQALSLAIIPPWLLMTFEQLGDRPQDPADARAPASPFQPRSDPHD